VPHPFIVQCVKQGCEEYFKDEDKLRNHLIEYHQCSDLIVRNYTIYAFSQIYPEKFCWWIKDKKEKFVEIRNYWQVKGKRFFKNCCFGKRHESLNMERIYVKKYFENVLNMKEISEELITIFLALLPIWKLLIFEKDL
jgi:hypothetical protein